MTADHHAFGGEGLLQHGNRLARLGAAAHEHIERSVAALGPGVDTDVAFGEDGHAADPAVGREGVEMDVEESCSCRVHGVSHGLLDTILVVEAFGFPKIDDQMAARECKSIARDEMIFLQGRGGRNILRRLRLMERHPSGDCLQTESASSHDETTFESVTPKCAKQVAHSPKKKAAGGRALPRHAALDLLTRAGRGVWGFLAGVASVFL
jgi:hypothetical protein